MAKDDYIPNREADLPAWMANFSSKLSAYATVLELPTADIAVIVADNLQVQKYPLVVEQMITEKKEFTDFKNIELYGTLGSPSPMLPAAGPAITLAVRPPGIVPRARAMAKRIKAHPAYTTSIGADLGIIGTEPSAPATPPKPTFTADVLAGYDVELNFAKAGHDSVHIEGKRAGETTWTFLARDSYKPYVDNRAALVAGQPEQRQYRMRYVDGDALVGIYSDVVSVTVGP